MFVFACGDDDMMDEDASAPDGSAADAPLADASDVGEGSDASIDGGEGWSVDAGENVETLVLDRVVLRGLVDGASPEEVQWTTVAGPAAAAITSPFSLESEAVFFTPGSYTIQLRVWDGETRVVDTLEVEVGEPTPEGPALVAADAPRELKATIHSLGVEWDVEDGDRDGLGVILVRPAESELPWQRSLNMTRIDYVYPEAIQGYGNPPSSEPRAFDMVAGSMFFLEENARFEVQVLLADRDGGYAQYETVVQTRAYPAIPAGAEALYVTPGGGGGSGSASDPYRGIAAAEAAASPGSLFLLGPGNYGNITFRASGSEGQPVRWAAQDRDARPNFSQVTVVASDVSLFGFDVRNPGGGSPGVRSGEGSERVGIRYFDVRGYGYSVALHRSSWDWTIVDSVLVGINDPGVSDFSGEGVEFNHSSGHVVAYNSISRSADGVSYPHRHCDVYNNDIFDTSDDGIEADFGYANNRFWANYVHNTRAAGISFQPQFSGPWYFLYNQVSMSGEGHVFKYNGKVDRNVFLNNTFATERGLIARISNPMTSQISRNNLYLTGGSRVFRVYDWGENEWLPDFDFYEVDWRTDLDHDGFFHAPSDSAYVWLGTNYADLDALRANVDIEENGLHLAASDFVDRSAPRIELSEGSQALGAGVRLPNVHPLAGAPDLGAHERGAAPWFYGPRDWE